MPLGRAGMKFILPFQIGIAVLLVSPDPLLAAEDDLDQALAIIEEQELSLGAVRLEIAEKGNVYFKGARHDQAVKFRLLNSGEKFRSDIERLDQKDPGQAQFSFDGTRVYSFSTKTKIGSVATSTSKDHPTYNANVYQRAEGLLSQLKAVRDQLHWEWKEIKGERLMEVTWKERGGEGTAEMQLNPKAKFQPRLVRRTYKRSVPDAYGKLGTDSKIDISDYREVDGRFFPSKWTRTTLVQFADRKLENSATAELTSIEPNATIADEEFVIKFPPGSRIHNVDGHEIVRVQEDGSWRPIPNSGPSTTTTSPIPWWADPWILWPIAIAISLAALWGAWLRFKAAND